MTTGASLRERFDLADDDVMIAAGMNSCSDAFEVRHGVGDERDPRLRAAFEKDLLELSGAVPACLSELC